MAPPIGADQLLRALRGEGLHVVEVGAWRSRNRNHMGPWGAVHGVMIHHTVTRGTAHTVAMCRDGYSGLPGPLCHGVIAKDGTVHLVGHGRANHAGLGDPDVLRAVIAETRLPKDDEATVDGNRAFYGFECENYGDGEDPWPDVQLDAIERVSAALCRFHDWGAGSVLGHLEWQPGKPDPKGFGMDWMRERVAGRLGTAVPGPLPVPQRPRVDLSLLVAAALADRYRPGAPVSYAGTRIVETALVDEGLLSKRWSDGHYGWETVAAYSRWQERLGYKGRAPGQAADGTPGMTSLKRLGDRRGFDVAA
ncbi:N-acetylmuramoyl-L-alanine amidase [Streptomyces sp. NBC_01233]|uniref:N-acetylmuramoyl-L-alanine amidase n=1 Tax=Streptomyces sp. NBC_01233 TaxID=2903787 RepID=UPI002E14941E|nr:N-acetylmuramoyl-L-alanine amidase [Streptomyces sp. NBC_01233]